MVSRSECYVFYDGIQRGFQITHTGIIASYGGVEE
jgi:hypothetical protein